MTIILDRIEKLEAQIGNLESNIQKVEHYSEFIYTNTFNTLTMVVAIVSLFLVGALYFFVKYTVNQKVDSEINKKVIQTMAENPPIFFSKGIGTPIEQKYIPLNNMIEGIEQLEPSTLIHVVAYPEHAIWGQVGNSLNPKIRINENGVREITLENYEKENGVISWGVIWTRKKY